MVDRKCDGSGDIRWGCEKNIVQRKIKMKIVENHWTDFNGPREFVVKAGIAKNVISIEL